MMRPVPQSAFSHSSLSSFETCPRKYWFRYVRKVPVETEGIEAFVGKRVHEILERLYRFVAEGRVPSLERVLYRYHRNFEEGFAPERVRIVRNGTEPELYRSLGARCLSNYYRRHYPFDGDETVDLERPVRFALDEDGRYAVRGIIDRLVRTRDGALEIHDFKTGRRVPPQDELDRDRQLALYELGVRAELGEQGPVRLVWHFALSDQVRSSERTPEQLDRLRRETAELIDRIRAEDTWETRTSALCDWCEYRAFCPAFGGEPPPPAEPAPDAAVDAALEATREDQLRLL